MSENVPAGAVPLPATLLQMLTGSWVLRALSVAAKLGVADLLAEGPRPIKELATATQAFCRKRCNNWKTVRPTRRGGAVGHARPLGRVDTTADIFHYVEDHPGHVRMP